MASTEMMSSVTGVEGANEKATLWKDVIIALLLFLLTLITVSGNVIVLLAFIIEKKLRNTFTYFIANLAVTDFFVGFVAMLFYTFDTVLGYWPFGTFMCGMWIFFDYAMTFASVFTLVAISVDRYWALMWSLHYRTHNNKRKAIFILGLVWALVLAIWLPPCILDRVKWSEPKVCWWDPSKNVEFVYFIAVVGHHVPCAIIIYCYICVLYLTRKRLKVRPGKKSKGHKRHVNHNTVSTTVSSWQAGSDSVSLSASTTGNAYPSCSTTSDMVIEQRARRTQSTDTEDGGSKEKKIFVTLSYILFTYLLCWLPFHIIFDISFIAPDLVSAEVYTFGFWLAYFNSTLNPIIYAYSNKEFRKAFKRVITCHCRK